MEAVNSARPLPHVDYVPTAGCEPSHRCACLPSPHRTEREREAPRSNRIGQPYTGNHDRHAAAATRPSGHQFKGRRRSPLWLPPCMRLTCGGRPSLKNRSRPPDAEGKLRNGHTTAECHELKKALHELAPPFLREEREPAQPQPWDEECSTEVVVTIAGGYAEGMTRSAWKAQLRGAQEAPHFASPHNDPLMVEMKIASVIVRRILIDTGSSMDTITWDCLKKLMYLGRDIVPLVHLILGIGGQEVNPTGMICLLLCFGDKLKARNLQVDFLVVDVPTADNVILGHLTLHKLKKGGYISGPPLSSRPSSSGVSALASKGLVASSLRPSPSSEEGDKLHLLGVLTLGLGRLAFINIMEVDLEPCSLALAALLAPAVTSASAVESASSSRCYKSFFSFSRASFSSSSFSQRHWYRVTSPSNLWCSTAAFTPRAKASAIVTSSLVTLWGSEVLEAAMVGLDKVRGRLKGTRGSTTSGLRRSPHGLRGASVFFGLQQTSFPYGEGVD
ncbi:hypothetical protein Cgig2_032109 [Carnegiea gigantea]|uniref:Peptidase A2 domain-containing protein n=1 Tax=Carnegiea gigantea TaxID=171969 RepID=A0A9Q1QB08_9CARY|nr:hypothetical protein Cgig2_032109 [Carnegiea gigantea]